MAQKIIKASEFLRWEGRERWESQRAGTAQSGEEKGHLTYVCQYLMGRSKDETARLSSMILSARTRGSWHKLNHKEFHLSTKNPTLYSDGRQTPAQVAQRDFGVSLLENI